MKTGMMWFDNDPRRSLAEKVAKAADYFREKYQLAPNTCMVHPSMLAEHTFRAGNVEVRPLRGVLPGHLWIGVEEDEKNGH
jgi:hypothetical protein